MGNRRRLASGIPCVLGLEPWAFISRKHSLIPDYTKLARVSRVGLKRKLPAGWKGAEVSATSRRNPNGVFFLDILRGALQRPFRLSQRPRGFTSSARRYERESRWGNSSVGTARQNDCP